MKMTLPLDSEAIVKIAAASAYAAAAAVVALAAIMEICAVQYYGGHAA